MNSKRMFVSMYILLALISSCGGSGGVDTRSFALGFTDFPHANSSAALTAAWSVIGNDADMASIHLDDGIPWPEALAHAPYNSTYMAELNNKAAAIPAGHKVYLSVTPISGTRDSLAAYRGTTGSMALPSPWNTYDFDHPDVISAFTNHCENMIAYFDPDYLTYSIEANMLGDKTPSSWTAYVTLAASVYSALKTSHPDLPLIITLQADLMHALPTTQTALINQILPYTDYIAMSTYAYTSGYTPATLPVDWFSGVADLAPDKPFAVGETAWPAETLTNPYPVTIAASEQDQADYVSLLLLEADKLDAIFVNWFFTRDFDDFWVSDFQYLPEAPIVRIWKDTGLYDGQGSARTGLSTWRGYLERRKTSSSP